MAIFAETIESLQLMINRLDDYLERWNLKINLEKSKIVIFRNGGRLAKKERWFYRGQLIEIVNEYKYLGVTLTSHLSWTSHFKFRYVQAATALNTTYRTFMNNRDIPHSTKYKIFNSVMKSVLCYAAQVWGFQKFEEVEKFQRVFIKKVFWLPRTTPNYMIYVETGVATIFLYTLKV